MKTRRNIFITIITVLTLMSSCAVISFYPIYTEDVLIKNNDIIGKWYSTSGHNGVDTLVWEISYIDKKKVKKQDKGSKTNQYAYWMVLHGKSEPEDKVGFKVHLLELDGKTYIDFYPEEWSVNNSMLALHLMSVHTFAQIDIHKGGINIDWLDFEWFEKQLKENKVRIKHEKNSSNILLTAQPKDLQKFVIKYSDDKNAFDKDSKFELKPLR